MYSGPHIKKDGLVFGYDTGYGIADKDTSTRYYPGKPATNEISDANLMSGWSSYSNGNDGTFTTEFGTIGYRINNRASWNGLYKDFSLPSTGTYTFSALFRYRGGSSSNNGATVYVSGWGGSDTATGIDKTKVNEWQRIEKTVSVTDTTLRYYLISYGGSGAVSSWDVTMPQIEKQTTRSPFLTGTRSSTQSLIDLTKTSNIDVSNMSFDSDGLPTFDGTDDRLEIANDVFTDNSSYTLSAWLRPRGSNWGDNAIALYNTYPSSGGSGFWHHFGHDNVLRWRHGGPSYTYGDLSGIGLVADTWQMTTITWDRTTLRLYKNGVQVNSTTAPSDFVRASRGARVGMLNYRRTSVDYNWNGEIDVHKVYNRALTPQEIKQNFKAYKNRFDI